MVANDGTCFIKLTMQNVKVSIQGFRFSFTYRLLSVASCDMVLGVEWLESLG